VSCLSQSIDPSELKTRNLKIAIIGCGESSLIKEYVEHTGSKYPIYADPTQSVYKEFALVRTLTWGGKADYMTVGLLGGIARGIWYGLKMGRNATKGGDMKQVGGEYGSEKGGTDGRFLLGPGSVCSWGHRMSSTTDHVEMKVLRHALGLDPGDTNEKPEDTCKPEVASKPRKHKLERTMGAVQQ
jgi:hypothetical protein